MPLNFRQLEVFRAVAETASFTRASHVLFISQSTVSQHIRELEESLNIKLFQRNRRNVTLTSAGENLLEHTRSIFQMLSNAEQAAKTVKDPFRGKVTFGCASTTLLYKLPPVLMEYSERYPNVELNITGGTIKNVATQLWSGALDLAVVVLPLSAPALRKIVLSEESFVWAISKSHPLARKKEIRGAEIAAERFILHRRGLNTRRLIDQYLYREEITPRIAMELDETEAIKALVARGFGVSILPESAFPDSRSSAGIRKYPIPHHRLHRTLAIVHPRAAAMRPTVSALISLLQEHFPQKNANS
jgi:LysR family transcriptional activator of glutamate synthase operon